MTAYRDVRTTEHEQGRDQRIATFKATQVIWLVLGLIEAVIFLRIVFKAIAVNSANPFATLLYKVSGFFVAPFASLTSSAALSSIIAMIVYLLIAWGLERIVYVAFYRPRGPVSVRQTIVADQIPQAAAVGVSQTTVTERTNTRTPGTL